MLRHPRRTRRENRLGVEACVARPTSRVRSGKPLGDCGRKASWLVKVEASFTGQDDGSGLGRAIEPSSRRLRRGGDAMSEVRRPASTRQTGKWSIARPPQRVAHVKRAAPDERAPFRRVEGAGEHTRRGCRSLETESVGCRRRLDASPGPSSIEHPSGLLTTKTDLARAERAQRASVRTRRCPLIRAKGA